MRRAAVVVVALTALLGACGDRGPEESTAEPDPASGCRRFVLFEDTDWTSQEAVDHPEDFGAWPEPGLDWYSEFERFTPLSDGAVEGVSLRVSGHDLGIDDLRDQLPGIELQEHGGNTQLFAGSGVDGQPSVVAKPVSDGYTLVLLSYGLDVEELVRVVSQARPVCQREWVEAGGQILDCLPTEPGCMTGS